MTKGNQLLRRPRPPKLQKIDFTNVDNGTPVATLNDANGSSSSSSRTDTPSTEHDYAVGSFLASELKTIPTTLPSLTPKNTQLLIKTYQEKNEKSFHDSDKHDLARSDTMEHVEVKTNYYDEEDKNALNFKTMSRTTYKRLLSISPAKRLTTAPSFKSRSVDIETLRGQRLNVIREYSQFKNTRNKVLRPFKPLGPDPLPAREPRHFEDKRVYYENLTYLEDVKPSIFTFNDFLLEKDNELSPTEKTKLIKSILSTKHYKGFCDALDEKLRKEKNNEKLHVQTLNPEMDAFEHRVPLRQIIIEMASYLKKELSEKMGVNLKAKLNQLPKWQNTQGAHTEIVVYEDENDKNSRQNTKVNEDPVTITQLAIVDSLLRNGLALSLKGHFIDKLPDLSALERTLIYINLSFNCFEEIPHELLNMPQIEAIKLRNNPIKSLPLELNQLTNLKILVLSYCQLDTDIPTSAYMLPNLRHLDVSYNKIKYISKLIVNLSKLKQINCEGNEIEYLPCSMLTMHHLQQINVKNNYLHPLLWRNSMKNEALKLFDLATLALSQNYERYKLANKKITSDVEYMLQNAEICDCCGGPRFGDGLKLIRPCVKVFGVKYLPFMFQCCSPQCFNSFRTQKSFYNNT